MPTPIAVFTADNHLRPLTWAKHRDLYGDAYESFRQIVDYCCQAQLPLLLLGDLFDKARPDSLSVAHYLEQMDRLRDAGLPVYFVEGNHDRASPPWASLSSWAQSVDRRLFNINGVTFYGLSFTSGGQLAPSLQEIPAAANVLLAHQSWSELQGVGVPDGSLSWLPRGMTVLTGDYHVCVHITCAAASGDPVSVYSPGSTSMQALNEPTQKFFGILHDDLSVTSVPLVTRQVQRVTVDTQADFEAALAAVQVAQLPMDRPQDIAKPVLNVRFDDSIPEAYARLVAAAADRYHLFLEPQRKIVTETVDDEAVPSGTFDDLDGAITHLCRESPDVLTGLQRLRRGTNHKEELDCMYAEFCKIHDSSV